MAIHVWDIKLWNDLDPHYPLQKARDRYGIYLEEHDYRMMCEQIRSGEAKLICKEAHSN
jgi:hypothetical protein